LKSGKNVCSCQGWINKCRGLCSEKKLWGIPTISKW